jgi:hypothetical protein
MHALLITGLANIGVPLLDQLLNKYKQGTDVLFNFSNIWQHLAKKGRLKSTITQMKKDLWASIQQNPLLNEFRKDPAATIAFEMDAQHRCIVKENGDPILICSKDSSLGELGIAYCNILQLEATMLSKKKAKLENVA